MNSESDNMYPKPSAPQFNNQIEGEPDHEYIEEPNIDIPRDLQLNEQGKPI